MKQFKFGSRSLKFFILVLISSSLVLIYEFHLHNTINMIAHKVFRPDLSNLKIRQTSDTDFLRRRQRVQNVCSSSNLSGDVRGVFTDQKSGVIYCFVPKAGCTFWKRVFKVLGQYTNATIEHLNKVPRLRVHNLAGGGVPFSPKNHNPHKFPIRLIVARDPFSRLLSSYLDKVYLPDFWATEVLRYISPVLQRYPSILNKTNNTYRQEPDFLRQHFDVMASKFEPNFDPRKFSTSQEKRCGKYMTFSEFVIGGFDRAEPHWMPIPKICNPCKFNVTHVSRMETYTEDARVILSKMKHGDILDELSSSSQVDSELQMIVEYNFHRVFQDNLNSFFKDCVTSTELAYRLWYNFRWRGYIDPDVDYQIPEFSDNDKVRSDLLSQIWRARETGQKKPESLKRAKRQFKQMAYRTVDKLMFDKLVKKYWLDFSLFGYDNVLDEMYKLYDNKD